MPTTVEEVERHLERDPALADVLVRGIANLRRTARWMIAEYDWDCTEEAVVSGLRRYAEEHSVPLLWAGRDQRRQTSVGLQTGLALLSVDRSFELHESMQKVWSVVGPFDSTALLPGRRHLRIVVDRFDLDDVRDALPQRSVTEIIAPVSAVELNLRQPAELDGDVGVLAHVVGVLAHQGIAIQDVATCTPDGLIFVPEDQAVAAYEFANELLRPEEEPNARDR
jgi:hypothetical protein